MNIQELIERIEGLKNIFWNECEYVKIDFMLELDVKNILARLRELPLHDREVWLKTIMGEFERDFSHAKWREGYEQGKLEGAMIPCDEPQKVQVPQFVADWYEENKDDFETNLFRAVDLIPSDYEEGDLSEFEEWLVDNHTEPFQTLVNMHQFGYDVKKERRYIVKMRTTKQPLFYNSLEKRLFFSLGELATQFTFKQLEEAGFGEVFNSPLFEVVEVTE